MRAQQKTDRVPRHELETFEDDTALATTSETKLPMRQRWVEREHLEL